MKRTRSGQAITAFMVMLAAFVVGPLCFVAYEVSMFNLCKQELKAATDSAALAAGATTASSDESDPALTQTSAMNTAMNMFKMNSVIGYSLASATQSDSATMTPAPNKAEVFFQFLDPVTRNPVALGSPNGKVIQVTAAYGYAPIFSKFIGMNGTVTAFETSNGGLPMLDVILCFDISASMDDFTQVTIVNRNTTNGVNTYTILAQGPLYNAFRCTGATGTALNACHPQELDSGGGAFSFSANARGTNNGAPPTTTQSTTMFTDVVVNLDATDTMSAGTNVAYNGESFTFPSASAYGIGILVEASRGNLESISAATQANIPYATWNITPRAGWYNAYQTAALALRHPLQDAIAAANNFFEVMNNSCDVHFGLVAFSSAAGTSPTQKCTSDIGASSIGYVTNSKRNHHQCDYCSKSIP